MHDLKFIRDNPADFDAAMKRRGFEEAQSPAILRLDEDRRSVQTQLQDLQAARNAKSKEIGKVKAQGGDAQPIMDEVSAMKDRMGELEGQERDLGAALNDVLAALPNVMFADVPDGADEDDNVELRTWGEIDKPSGPDHVEIGETLGMMDAETAANMSGSRFTFDRRFSADGTRLGAIFLDTHTAEHGYLETSPPLLVRDNALYGTGQLPKFAEDLFGTKAVNPEALKEFYELKAECEKDGKYLSGYLSWKSFGVQRIIMAYSDLRSAINQYRC